MIDYLDSEFYDFDFQFVPAYLKIVQINGTIAFIFHIYLIFIIILKSSREMGHYKLFLLNIAIMSFIHDTILSTLWKPIPILPIIGGYSAGPAKYLGKHFGGHFMLVLLVAFVILYLASILSGFLYRLSALLRKKWYDVFISGYGITLIFMVHILPTLGLCIPLYFSNVDDGIVKEKVTKKYPKIGIIFESENVFVYDLQINPCMEYFLIGAIALILLLPPITGGCIYGILRILHGSQHHLQAKTIKLHRQLLVALIIQIILPIFLIIFPIVIVCIFIYLEFPHTSVCIQAAIICCTFHSIADTIVMIFMISPYRKATNRLFLWFLPAKIKAKIKSKIDGGSIDAASNRGGITQTQILSTRTRSISIIIN